MCFRNRVQSIVKVFDNEIIALDGKTLRRSHDNSLGKSAIHMVSALGIAKPCNNEPK